MPVVGTPSSPRVVEIVGRLRCTVTTAQKQKAVAIGPL